MSNRIPCRFHQHPGGCRRGDNCTFLHVDSSSGAVRTGNPATHARSDVDRRSGDQSRAPPGVCNEFWLTGKCRRSFDCRYRHIERQEDSRAIVNPPQAGLDALSRRAANSFSPAAQNLNPIEVHNHMRRYLVDGYHFRTSNEIYAFMRLLANATEENKWTVEDGQLLLTTLATVGHNGLLRLGDILRHSDVTINAGMSADKLSFQRGYLPLLAYFSSDFVAKSAVNYNVNALYTLVYNDFNKFAEIFPKSMEALMSSGSFKDPLLAATSQNTYEFKGNHIFSSLAKFFFEYLTRFRHATATQPILITIVRNLQRWLDTWIAGIMSDPPTFEDVWASNTNHETRSFVTDRMRNQIAKAVIIVDREQAASERALHRRRRDPAPVVFMDYTNAAIVSALQTEYVGPGDERPDGPRNDNDFADIRQIRIAPTHEELTCQHKPFLPANIPNAPHHLPAGSMERLLDIQFRLLREELIAPIRTAVQLVLQDLSAPPRKQTTYTTLLSKRGGRYNGEPSPNENIIFNLYTNCTFHSFALHPHRGITVVVSFDAPPGSARSPKSAVRSNFWEGNGGKRLMQGGLVALVWGTGRDRSVYLGIVASSLKDLADSAKRSDDERVQIRISFFDPEAELRILKTMKNRVPPPDTHKLLIEAPVMFEAIRPFLNALRVEPTSVPFSQYLAPLSTPLTNLNIGPPKYATAPGFNFDMRCLFKTGTPEMLRLSAIDPLSVDSCRNALRASHSRLDASQADAMVDALTREVALIQGPPGTGKTYIGIEILRVLLTNKVGPVLMIAFTNHALDHMLSSVLEAGISDKILRLGSRSADERISKFNLDTMGMVQDKSRLDGNVNIQYKIIKETQEAMDKLMNEVRKTALDGTQMEAHIQFQYPDDYASLFTLSPWVDLIRRDLSQNLGWETVGSERTDDTLFSFWENGKDLNFLKVRQTRDFGTSSNGNAAKNNFDALRDDEEVSNASGAESSDSEDAELEVVGDALSNEQGFAAKWMQTWPIPGDTRGSSDASAGFGSSPREPEGNAPPGALVDPVLRDDFFTSFGLKGPSEVPHADRPLDQLLSHRHDLWQLSDVERKRLARYWRDEALLHNERGQLEEFRYLRRKYEDARTRYNELKDQSQLRLMRGVEIVGCTTTGAAKLTALLKGFSPKVMLVEEAGQVLEAHVLGSLVPSVEHLILIGDPQQLRPNLANFNLSIDSHRGAALYRFDVSLMERLSTSGLSMSQLNVQRRMRPSIADLVRKSLYPNLQDHGLTEQYPHVRGMATDVFFLSHGHREAGGGEDSVSKHNMFEVKMIVDLVLYLLRQGRYSDSGDIVVLCAYLGQLIRMRDALAGKVVTVIDDRDQEMLEMLAEHEEEREDLKKFANVKNVPISQKVLLRTIDNYQGEEAKITILSLVRNGGSNEDDQERASSVSRPSIGFLKSINRTNVALSRAKHGLYILGNASDLAAKSSMWRTVLEILEVQDAVGNGFLISCAKHPEEQHSVSEPGMLPQLSPDGGCLKPCGEPLRCGHTCPYKCHSDDEEHVSISCSQPCLRLCPQGHPCDKQCSRPCGKCQHPVLNVELPCGHHRASVRCHEVSDDTAIDCYELVVKSQSTCEHVCKIKCGTDPASRVCGETCGNSMPCCGRSCTSTCHDCQSISRSSATEGIRVLRTRHKPHPCRRALFCGHPCREPCSEDHECTTRCLGSCLKSCEHMVCKQPCNVVCAPCAEPCSWACTHQGTCPVPCGSVCARLPCDVRCTKDLPCGHRCPSLCGEPCSICIYCAPVDRKQDIVDLIMQTTLEEIDPGNTLDDLIITLACGHTFTVASLDGVCEMDQFYRRLDSGQWVGLDIPPPGFRSQPGCPTCRSPITIPRYGRIFKRSGLDLAERTVASDMSRSLQDVSAALHGFDKEAAQQDITQVVINGTIEDLEPVTPKAASKLENAQNRLLQEDKSRPIAADNFILTAEKRKKNLHFVPPSTAKTWRSTIRPLSRAYSIAVEIISRRPAHTVAYENAFSTLYRQEMDEAEKHPTHAPRRPTEHAMRMARLKVGQPRAPRADKRFSVEALWLSMKIRFLMGELAETRLKAMQEDAKSSTSDRFVWASFVRFIYLSCTRDVKIALDIALESQSHRQIVTSHLMELRAQFEQHRFDVGMRKEQPLLEDERLALLSEIRDKYQAVQQCFDRVVEGYLLARGEIIERKWLAAHFTAPASTILDQWKALEQSIDKRTFFQPVSLEEMTNVVQAFGFSHTGHWYACENGHAFVITECGGAMETASCPECGSVIGGTGHNLHATNVRHTGMENIGRAQGALRSPWDWARGA